MYSIVTGIGSGHRLPGKWGQVIAIDSIEPHCQHISPGGKAGLMRYQRHCEHLHFKRAIMA